MAQKNRLAFAATNKRDVSTDYVGVIGSVKPGDDLTLMLLIQVEGKHLAEVEKKIASYQNVFCVYEITGDFDIAVFTRFKDDYSLNIFFKELLSVRFIKTTLTLATLNVVKEDACKQAL